MKTSFITTVFNEENTVTKFLNSLLTQTKLPDEVTIVDGGSTDKTVALIEKKVTEYTKKKNVPPIKWKIIIKKGNRSIGRNEAIKKSTGTIIVCSDAGNLLAKNWFEEITKPFTTKGTDVVAGYYKGKTKTIFQKCLIPFALVMPDQIDERNFLPATRSIAFTKKIWKKVGGFDENLSHNEDYAFAHKLRDAGTKIVFTRSAIVYWIPRTSFKEAFVMFYRFALGDAEAGLFRSKVLLLFFRYCLGIYLVLLSILYKSSWGMVVLGFLFICYLLWSIKKIYRYIESKKSFFFLPAF